MPVLTAEFVTTLSATRQTVEFVTELAPPTYKLGWEVSDDQQYLIVYNDTDLTQDGLPESLGLNVINIMSTDNQGYCRVLQYPYPAQNVLAWQVELNKDGLYILQLVNEVSRNFQSGVNFPISQGTEVYATWALVTTKLDSLLSMQFINNGNRIVDTHDAIDYREQLLLTSHKAGLIGEYNRIVNLEVVDYADITNKFEVLNDEVNFPSVPND